MLPIYPLFGHTHLTTPLQQLPNDSKLQEVLFDTTMTYFWLKVLPYMHYKNYQRVYVYHNKLSNVLLISNWPIVKNKYMPVYLNFNFKIFNEIKTTVSCYCVYLSRITFHAIKAWGLSKGKIWPALNWIQLIRSSLIQNRALKWDFLLSYIVLYHSFMNKEHPVV